VRSNPHTLGEPNTVHYTFDRPKPNTIKKTPHPPVVACGCSFSELACGKIGDLDFEVKWSCLCEEFCSGRDGCILEVEVMTAEELLERYAAGERDFSGADLRHTADLTAMDLQGVVFRNARLGHQDLRFINFTKADLSGARMAECDLTGANLTGANLSQVDLSQSNLSEAKLAGSILREATLGEVDFTSADLTSADLTNAKNLRQANFFRANLTSSILLNIDSREPEILDEAIFKNTVMPDGSIRNP
jgi:hypothetical protein